MPPNIGYSTLSIIPSLKGMDGKMRSELTGVQSTMSQAGAKAGKAFGDEVVKGADDGIAKLKQRATKMNDVGKKLSLGLSAPIAAGIGVAIQKSSALNEQIDATTAVFGESAGSILDWAKTTDRSMGISERAALQASVGFGNMLQTAGIATDASADMSKVIVKLAADMASFNDQDPSEMLDKLRSGLAGETEPLRRFGVFMSESAVQSQALKDGLIEAGQEMTDAQKVQARYSLILEQTAKQQDNFADTADSLANRQRVAAAVAENSAASFGDIFQPAAKLATGAVTALASGFDRLPQSTKGVVSVLLTMAAAAGPILLVVGKVKLMRLEMARLKKEALEANAAVNSVGKAGGGLARLGITARAAGGAALAASVGMVAFNKAQEQGAANASEMAGELAKKTIPSLLKTGGALEVTGQDTEYLFGLFGSGNRKQIAKTFADLNKGSITTGGAVKRLGEIAGVSDEQLRGMVGQQIAASLEQANLLGKVDEFGTVASSAFQIGQLTAEELVVQLKQAGLKQGELNKLIKAIPDETFRNQVIGTLRYADAQAKLADETENAKESVVQFAGLSGKDFTKWRKSTVPAIMGVDDALSDLASESASATSSLADGTKKTKKELRELAGQAKVTAGEILDSFTKQLKAQRDYSKNWEALVKRDLPAGMTKELQEMGLEGAGVVDALANANDREFKKIIETWRKSKREAKNTANAIDGHLSELAKKDYKVGVSVEWSAAKLKNFELTGTISGQVKFREHGGPVEAGQPYIVGERRPELFVPDTDGVILPRVPTSGAGVADGGVYIENLNITDSPDPERTYQHFKRRLGEDANKLAKISGSG